MSHTRILSQMNTRETKDPATLHPEEKTKRGKVFLKQALLLLNNSNSFVVDNLIQQNPKLTKLLIDDPHKLQIDSPQDRKKSNFEVLIEQSKWLLKTAVELGNDDANELLKTLNEQKIYESPQYNDIAMRQNFILNEDDEEETVRLLNKIEISDANYFKR